LAANKHPKPSPFLSMISKKIKKTALMNQLADQSILILGMGREGASTLKFLQQHFPEKNIAVADQNEVKIENHAHLTTYFGEKYLDALENYEIIIKPLAYQ
jgi:UDP-N-acetylmuramoylalanine-D-glutamate ligase